jgi:hypothetical protein
MVGMSEVQGTLMSALVAPELVLDQQDCETAFWVAQFNARLN